MVPWSWEVTVEVDIPVIHYCWWIILGNTDHVCSQRTISSVNVPAFMAEGLLSNIPNLKIPSGQNPPARFLPSQRFLDSGKLQAKPRPSPQTTALEFLGTHWAQIQRAQSTGHFQVPTQS